MNGSKLTKKVLNRIESSVERKVSNIKLGAIARVCEGAKEVRL